MEIRKLTTWEEWLESDRVIATAFLHKWEEEKARASFQAQAEGKEPREDEAWGLFNDSGRMTASIITQKRAYAFDGQIVPAGEVHMVASLPEERGGGHIRSLMADVLRDFRARGDIFAVLIPFSFAFYRKFGFELVSRSMSQKADMAQLAEFTCDYTVRRVDAPEDVQAVRALYDQFILDKNLAPARSEKDWAWRGNGEYGEPNWWRGDATQYTYLFADAAGQDHAYLKFLFAPGPDGPFVGSMEVTDLVYDSPEALRQVLGFCYGMRAKMTEINLELMDDLDLAAILPESDKVERKLGGHFMGRLLDVRKALLLMHQPQGEGSYTIRLEDSFLPENSGLYTVSYRDGKASDVVRSDDLEGMTELSSTVAPDLEVTQETLCPMILGRFDLKTATYRPGTKVNGKQEILAQAFPGKVVCGG